MTDISYWMRAVPNTRSTDPPPETHETASKQNFLRDKSAPAEDSTTKSRRGSALKLPSFLSLRRSSTSPQRRTYHREFEFSPRDDFYSPDPDQMVNTLQTAAMARLGESLPPEYNSLVLHVLEAYRNQKKAEEALKAELVGQQKCREADLQSFEREKAEWLDQEQDQRDEIKRLELLIAGGAGGMKSLASARAESLLRRDRRGKLFQAFISLVAAGKEVERSSGRRRRADPSVFNSKAVGTDSKTSIGIAGPQNQRLSQQLEARRLQNPADHSRRAPAAVKSQDNSQGSTSTGSIVDSMPSESLDRNETGPIDTSLPSRPELIQLTRYQESMPYHNRQYNVPIWPSSARPHGQGQRRTPEDSISPSEGVSGTADNAVRRDEWPTGMDDSKFVPFGQTGTLSGWTSPIDIATEIHDARDTVGETQPPLSLLEGLPSNPIEEDGVLGNIGHHLGSFTVDTSSKSPHRRQRDFHFKTGDDAFAQEGQRRELSHQDQLSGYPEATLSHKSSTDIKVDSAPPTASTTASKPQQEGEQRKHNTVAAVFGSIPVPATPNLRKKSTSSHKKGGSSTSSVTTVMRDSGTHSDEKKKRTPEGGKRVMTDPSTIAAARAFAGYTSESPTSSHRRAK